LRRMADSLEALGNVQAQDVTFSSQPTDGEDDLSVTVYYHREPPRRRDREGCSRAMSRQTTRSAAMRQTAHDSGLSVRFWWAQGKMSRSTSIRIEEASQWLTPVRFLHCSCQPSSEAAPIPSEPVRSLRP